MKLRIAAFLFLSLSSLVLNAQALIPLDTRDPIGQRLGWTPDKIVEGIKQQPYYAYLCYLTLGAKPGNILVYQTAGGETLAYEIQNGVAVEAILTVPKKSATWADRIVRLQATCPLIYALPDSFSSKYKGPYCNILVYENTDSNNGNEEVCFRYFDAL